MEEDNKPTTAQNNENVIHNKHDKGYKFLLSSKRVFLELLRSFVKQGWVDKIDESSLDRIDKSFILQDFKEQESDLIYRVKMKDQDVIFYVLMEFQSKVDFQMPYRLLLYMVEIWRSILKDTPQNEAVQKEFKLPAIVPIVLYNGEHKWTASPSYKEYLSGYELFNDYVMDFKYVLIDVNRYDEKALLELSNLIGSVFLFDQEIGSQEIVARLNKIIDVLRKFSPEEFLMFKNWIMNIVVRALPEEQQAEIIKLIEESEGAEMLVYNVERTLRKERIEIMAEGEAKGKAEGEATKQREIAIAMIRKGLESTLIAEVTGLTLEQVDELRQLAAN